MPSIAQNIAYTRLQKMYNQLFEIYDQELNENDQMVVIINKRFNVNSRIFYTANQINELAMPFIYLSNDDGGMYMVTEHEEIAEIPFDSNGIIAFELKY